MALFFAHEYNFSNIMLNLQLPVCFQLLFFNEFK